MFKKWGLGLGLLLVLGIGACSLLLPERFAVNAPILHMMLGGDGIEPDAENFGSRIRAADGFSIGIFASGISNARWLRPTSGGHLLVSQPRSGKVLLLEPDRDGDGQSDARRVLLEELDRPHGLDLYDGWLYVGEADGVGRTRFDPETGQRSGEYERVVDGLPEGGNHWTRTVRFGPDGWMYVSVGSSCNVCEDPPRRAAMLRFRPDGSDEQIFASGLRNAVGYDWQPGTGDLYATDNGRDLLGDDFPPCELNRVVQGGFYGWPYVNGDGHADPDFGDARPDLSRRAISPAHPFAAHNAPLGFTFIRNAAAPVAYRGAALAALHGSWNRTRKDGYKVVSLHWDEAGHIEERDFVVGFETDEDVAGRPVDVAEADDGTIYISDDYAGSVYRVTATGASGAVDAVVDSPAAEPASAAHSPADPEAEARGERLYERFACASCHEVQRAEAGVVVVELADLPSRYSVADLAAFLRAPTPPMPTFPMEAAERSDLAAFLLRNR